MKTTESAESSKCVLAEERTHRHKLQECRARPNPTGCKSPEAVRVAEEALQQINQDLTHGYILSLNRLYDLSHAPEKERDGLLYRLTIDVMETECHITSRKQWKQCEVRDISEVPVYGECEVFVYVDTAIKLQNYSCALHEVREACEDCPKAVDLNDPVIKEIARLSLQKFNKKSHLANYFIMENITKASSQWVVGPAYFVDFTIVETVCSKKTDASELNDCSPMDCQFAHRGYCISSHVTREEQFATRLPVGKKHSFFQPVRVKCEIYEPQAAAAEAEAHAKADSEHTEHQHHNHTHLHPHEHVHSYTPSPDNNDSEPRVSLGTVVNQPASPRSAPAARSCPGRRRHNLGLSRLGL
ncbi:hypothetical protein PAMP_023954 [Pampus punctatissimus]